MTDLEKLNWGGEKTFAFLRSLNLESRIVFQILGRAMAATLEDGCQACFEKNLATINRELRQHYQDHGSNKPVCSLTVKH